jgi:hypothetical protein
MDLYLGPGGNQEDVYSKAQEDSFLLMTEKLVEGHIRDGALKCLQKKKKLRGP